MEGLNIEIMLSIRVCVSNIKFQTIFSGYQFSYIITTMVV